MVFFLVHMAGVPHDICQVLHLLTSRSLGEHQVSLILYAVSFIIGRIIAGVPARPNPTLLAGIRLGPEFYVLTDSLEFCKHFCEETWF